MWVDFDDLRAEIECLQREVIEELDEEKDLNYRKLLYGISVGYRKVEKMLDELEEVYRKQGLEHIKSLMEEQNAD